MKSAYCSSASSSHLLYNKVSLGAILTMVSICPSVSSPISLPCFSQIMRFAFSLISSSSSISSLSIGSLRLASTKQHSVVIIVPFPSLSIEPPSSTISSLSDSLGLPVFSVSKAPSSCRVRVTILSSSASNFSPQPSNLKSSIVSFPSSAFRVIGPWSRAHVSLVLQKQIYTFVICSAVNLLLSKAPTCIG